MSDANLASIAYAIETTIGVAPTSLKAVRFTGESLSFEKETVSSSEIRSDRQTSDMAKVGSQPSGGFDFELSYAFILPFLAAALHNDWTSFAVTASGVINHTTQRITGAAAAYNAVPVGALAKVTGATTQGNNGLKRVIGKALDGSYLIFAPGSFTATDGAANVTLAGKSITNGIARKTMTLEKRVLNNEGNDFFQRYLGMTVDTMELKIESKKLITGTIGMIGTTYEIGNTGIDPGALEAAAATGLLTLTANMIEGNNVTIGATVYSFWTAANNPNDVPIGVSTAATIASLIAAVNGTDGLSPANPLVVATAGAGTTMAVTAIVAGAGGNTIPTTSVLGASGSWGAATLTGGVTQTAGYTAADGGEVMNGTNNIGLIQMDGTTAVDRFKSITVQIANNVRGKDACGIEGNWDIGLGQVKVTGALNAYFRDNDLPTKIKNHTTFALGFSLVDGAGNELHFYLPSVKPAKGDPKITAINTDVMIETSYEAILGNTTQNPIAQTIIVDAIDA